LQGIDLAKKLPAGKKHAGCWSIKEERPAMDIGANHQSQKAFDAEKLALRFQQQAIDLARSRGEWGSLRTLKSSLQKAYASVLALLDHPETPLMIFGERGAGKRRHVDEFFAAHNFFRKLSGKTVGQLRVFRSDFVSRGFTLQLLAPQCPDQDMIYIERVEELSTECQQELMLHLKARTRLAQRGLPLPRLVVGTERALSILVLRGTFLRDLFAEITRSALFLPSLNERPEDVPQLVQSLLQEFHATSQVPPAWLVDFVSSEPWSENLDELRKLLKAELVKNPNPNEWVEGEIIARRLGLGRAFLPTPPRDVSVELHDRKRYQQALLKNGGDRELAAFELGMTRSEFLKRMMALGLR
jgi:transcriptional regulator with AAA-type ATPase domain